MKCFLIFVIAVTLVSFSSAHTIDFEHFWSWEEVEDYMEDMLIEYPQLFSVESAGVTLEGRNINAYRISNGTAPGTRPTIFIESGMQGRDWLSVMFSMYIIHEIVEHDYEYPDIFSTVDLVFIPVANPDGFAFTQASNGDRNWNKNRRNVGSNCFGVNINRNFQYQFAESSDPCSADFSGVSFFSEPESRAVQIILNRYSANLIMVLSLQSGGSQILYPYSFIQLASVHEARLRDIANEVNQATSTSYNVGSAGALNRVESGTITDYTYANTRVTNSFIWRLPGENWIFPENSLGSTLTDLFRGFLVFTYSS